MLKEQTAERQAQTGLASQRLATDEAFRKAQQEHYNTMEGKQADANDIAQQRAASQEDQGFLHTVIAANAAGMLDDDALDQVNDSLANHPRLSRTGIQLSKPKVTSPQAGQNATAQAVQQAEYWHQQGQTATTDEDKARFMENEDIMRSIAQKSAAPVAPKPDRSIEVETDTPVPGSLTEKNKVRQKMTPAEYDIYQQRNKAKPLDPQTAAAMLKEVGGDKTKARALAIQRGYSLMPAQ